MTSTLFDLAFLTQKIIHAETGHLFLVYFMVDDDDTCTIDLTIAGPETDDEGFDTRLLGRWWTTSLSADELSKIVELEDAVTRIGAGELHIQGWNGRNTQKEDVELKLGIDPEGSSKSSVSLAECSSDEALFRHKMLLLKITERAQTQGAQVFCPETTMKQREDLADLHAEVSRVSKQLKKRDEIIDDLQEQLNTAHKQLEEYVRNAEPAKPAHALPKVPANHSKAAVTKKRRLVQQVEYED